MSVRIVLPVVMLAWAIATTGCKKKGGESAEAACVGPITEGKPQVFKIGEVEWELAGSTLRQRSPATTGALRIGVLSDIKEDTQENLDNLKTAVDAFMREKVDMIIVAGDTGETQSQIETALAILARAQVPVLNIMGNREGRGEYRKAMEGLRAKYANIFDLNTIRRVDTPAADIVSMPGYYNPSYIHSDDGCQYLPQDVSKLGGLVATCDSPVLLVSHGGPRQDGPQAIDRTAEGGNVGDPALTKLIKEKQVPFGIFGNIHEAGGRATDISGKKVLDEGVMYDTLYLNPGPADGVRWPMNDGSLSVGMAAFVEIKGGKGRYATFALAEVEEETGVKKPAPAAEKQ